MAAAALTPVAKLVYRAAGDGLEVVAKAGRNIWLVGKKEPLLKAARELGALLSLPLLEKQAEALDAGYKGAKAETPWADGAELRKVTLFAVPETANRSVTPVRPDAISKELHGKVAGSEVVLAVSGSNDIFAAGLAVSRCLPPYTQKTDKVQEPSECMVSFHGCAPSEEQVKMLQLTGESVRVAQALVDRPPNVLYPTSMKEIVLDMVKDIKGVTTKVIEGEELKEKGYGLIYAVGKCAMTPPVLMILTHPGDGSGKKGVAIVGKGITFDTGGAALKSRDGMIGMKRDMGGSAGMFGAFLALAKSGGLPSGRPLHCVLCIAENGIGKEMFLMDDIIRGYSGLTVEITNTDAEGRLVLADGVAHAAKHLDVDFVAEMATLTGAQKSCTGVHHGLVLTNDEELEREALLAGKASGDMVHPGLFAPEILMHEYDSKFADMRNNLRDVGNCPSSLAGLFIHKHLLKSGFEGRWLHVDMAYPVSKPLDEHATGWGVGFMVSLLTSQSKL